jgi:hypothetical protein
MALLSMAYLYGISLIPACIYLITGYDENHRGFVVRLCINPIAGHNESRCGSAQSD